MATASNADPVATAVRFNDSITRRDVDALAGLMTDDHMFVDSAGNTVVGKRECLTAWRDFFVAFPHYRNVFTAVSADGDVVTAEGYCEYPIPQLSGPARWFVTVQDDRVARWHITASGRVRVG